MKEPFEPVVIREDVECTGDTVVAVPDEIYTDFGFVSDHVKLTIARRDLALTADEAYAIGKALIAAADYIQK